MPDDAKPMTWAEAAKALGVKVESVQRRARSRKWKKAVGNDGRAIVWVPLSALDTVRTDNPPDIRDDDPPALLPDDPQESARVSALEAEVRVLREAMVDLRADRDAWRLMAQKRRSWWPW